MPHRGDQDHRCAEVDLAAEEAQGGRGVARPALMAGAAEAVAKVCVLAHPGRAASWLAVEVARVEPVTADHAGLLARLRQERPISLQLESVEPRILHERWVQEGLLLAGALDRHGQDRTE